MGKKFLTATEGRENSLPDCRLRGQIPDCRRQLEADLRVPIRNRPVILQYAKSEFLNTDLAMLDALAIPGLKIETGGTRHPAKVDKKFLTGTEGVEESTSGLPVALPGPACSRKSTLHYITYLGSISDLAEITGQPYKTGWMPETLIWRGAQRCFIIFQLGFLPFGKVRPAHNNGLTGSGGRLELIWTERRGSRSQCGLKSHICSGDRNSSNREL